MSRERSPTVDEQYGVDFRAMGAREGALGAVEHELRQEIAGALGRCERKLVEARAVALDAFAALSDAREAATDPARLAELSARYEQRRAAAEQRRWMLEVQREATGARDHRMLDELFPPLPR